MRATFMRIPWKTEAGFGLNEVFIPFAEALAYERQNSVSEVPPCLIPHFEKIAVNVPCADRTIMRIMRCGGDLNKIDWSDEFYTEKAIPCFKFYKTWCENSLNAKGQYLWQLVFKKLSESVSSHFRRVLTCITEDDKMFEEMSDLYSDCTQGAIRLMVMIVAKGIFYHDNITFSHVKVDPRSIWNAEQDPNLKFFLEVYDAYEFFLEQFKEAELTLERPTKKDRSDFISRRTFVLQFIEHLEGLKICTTRSCKDHRRMITFYGRLAFSVAVQHYNHGPLSGTPYIRKKVKKNDDQE